MQINTEDTSNNSGFYIVGTPVFLETLKDSKITAVFDLGGDIKIHYGSRNFEPVWILENPNGKNAIWIEE